MNNMDSSDKNSHRRVIVNADDFGCSQSVNQGIIKAHQLGIVTSTSMMVNMPGTDEAFQLAKQNPQLGVGLHINLTYGRPILAPALVPSLVNKSGNFYSVGQFILRVQLGKIRLADLQQEITAQFKRFLASGIVCTHFDGHRHIHCIPKVFRVATQEAKRFNVSKCRISLEKPSTPATTSDYLNPLFYVQQSKAKLLDYWSQRCMNIAAESRMTHPQSFYGIVGMSDTRGYNFFKDLIDACETETSEIMCHPGLTESDIMDYDGYDTKQRQRDLDLITSPETIAAIQQRQLQLISFREL